MVKILNDKYYTPIELARRLIKTTYEVLSDYEITDVIEPSAGDGAFSKNVECTAYDIEPQGENIIKADFLTLDIPYKRGRLFIGNPPFGPSNATSVKFFRKCCTLGDYIAFVQPISQLDNNIQMYLFDLIYSEDLGVVKYSDRELHCCFNIYKRPNNLRLNKKPNYRLKDITIIDHRRKTGDYTTGANGYISPDYDYAMCIWGNGTLGKVPSFMGEYVHEVYFYCHKKEFLPKMLKLLEHDTIRNYVNSVSMKSISVMRLYKYLKDNIEGIE